MSPPPTNQQVLKKLKPEDKELMGKPLMKRVMQSWLPAADALLEMMIWCARPVACLLIPAGRRQMLVLCMMTYWCVVVAIAMPLWQLHALVAATAEPTCCARFGVAAVVLPRGAMRAPTAAACPCPACRHLPSPGTAQKYRVDVLYEGEQRWKCGRPCNA